MALTPLFCTGFEPGRLDAVVGIGQWLNGGKAAGSGLSVTDASARNGSYGLHVEAPGSAGEWIGRQILGMPSKIVMRFAVNVTSLPVTNPANLAEIYMGGSGRLRCFSFYRWAVERSSPQFGHAGNGSHPFGCASNVARDRASILGDWEPMDA